MFDLAVSGFTYFTRFGRVLSQRAVSRDPLSGVLDGVNKVFYTNYFPLLTLGSFTVYDGTSQVSGTANYDTGEVTLNLAPANQPVASYTFTPYTATQILNFLISGFDEMEMRWTRLWKLVNAAGVAADETSANIYVADKNGADPVVGDLVFSTSRASIALLMACVELRYYLSQLGEAAIADFMFRETLRGLTVDKSRVPQNLDLMVARAEKRVEMALQAAQNAAYPGGEQFGGYQPSPATVDYMQNFEWQTQAILYDNRTVYGYQNAVRPFGV